MSAFFFFFDSQLMSSSNLVLARIIYSGSCHGAHAHDREPPALKLYSKQIQPYGLHYSAWIYHVTEEI